jgi:hypothetical protein
MRLTIGATIITDGNAINHDEIHAVLHSEIKLTAESMASHVEIPETISDIKADKRPLNTICRNLVGIFLIEKCGNLISVSKRK